MNNNFIQSQLELFNAATAPPPAATAAPPAATAAPPAAVLAVSAPDTNSIPTVIHLPVPQKIQKKQNAAAATDVKLGTYDFLNFNPFVAKKR